MLRKINNIVSEAINEYINNIINESKDLLTERVSSIVYHWVSPQTAIKIFNTNRFSLMNNLFKRAESNIIGTSHKRMWYMSLTRNGKIGMGGYSNNDHPWVRLTLDGDKLNSNFHTKGIDYWGASMGKNARYDKTQYNVSGHVNKPGSETESEDRLYSRKPFIEDALSYIKAIDIYIDLNKYNGTDDCYMSGKMIESVYYIFLKYNKSHNCNVYTTVQDFNNHKNPIDYKTFSEWVNKAKETRNLSYYDIDKENKNKLSDEFLASVVYIVNFLDGDFNDCIRTLKEYGLGKYAKSVANYMKNYHGWSRDYYFGDRNKYDLNALQRTVLQHFENIELGNGAQSLDREDLAKAYTILSDFCRKHKLKTKHDIIEYFANSLNKKEKNIKWDELIEVNTVKLSYNSKLHLCINPNEAKYADIFGKDVLRWIYDDITYYVNSHKSKSDESFKSYLKHLLLKGNPTVQEIIDLYDNLKSLGNDNLEPDYKPEIITKQVSYYEISYALRYPDYEYGNYLHFTDETSVKVITKEQYKQLEKLVNDYEVSVSK